MQTAELTTFYGNLDLERFDHPQASGLLCALDRLTPEEEEKARAIEAKDASFKYLSADKLANAMPHKVG
ncbi:MAG: hypothetical protein QOH50_3422 [Kribbellaceae bacterium]|nr:hypothetical protein [Kribbellaceae bacterium]